MAFGHEQLDVYRAAIEYVGWAYRLCESLKGKHRNARDQLLRASQGIPLNIAEGNGKATEGDRRRFFEIARGSALECAAVQDVLEVCGALSSDENAKGKELLDRIVAMLTKLGQRGYSIREDSAEYGAGTSLLIRTPKRPKRKHNCRTDRYRFRSRFRPRIERKT
jgi:four helix bundle protein